MSFCYDFSVFFPSYSWYNFPNIIQLSATLVPSLSGADWSKLNLFFDTFWNLWFHWARRGRNCQRILDTLLEDSEMTRFLWCYSANWTPNFTKNYLVFSTKVSQTPNALSLYLLIHREDTAQHVNANIYCFSDTIVTLTSYEICVFFL